MFCRVVAVASGGGGCVGGLVLSKGNGRWGVLSGSGGGGGGGKCFWGSGEFSVVVDGKYCWHGGFGIGGGLWW